MRTVDVIIGVGWLVFWLGWLAAAANVKSGHTDRRRYFGVRLGIALLFISLSRMHAFRGHGVQNAWLAGIGLSLFVFGLAVAVWARVHLGRNWGTPMSEKDDPELVMTGPYRWVRNPIYSGIILAMIGTGLAVSLGWLAIAAVAGGYFVYSAIREQHFMAEQFPETYPAYLSSTKMLIPFVF